MGWALGGVAALFVLAIAFVFLSRAFALHQMYAELDRLKIEKMRAEQRRQTLHDLLARRQDARLLEELARTRYGYVKKGEKKFKIKIAPPESP
jgi:cell division protein FtsB